MRLRATHRSERSVLIGCDSTLGLGVRAAAVRWMIPAPGPRVNKNRPRKEPRSRRLGSMPSAPTCSAPFSEATSISTDPDRFALAPRCASTAQSEAHGPVRKVGMPPHTSSNDRIVTDRQRQPMRGCWRLTGLGGEELRV